MENIKSKFFSFKCDINNFYILAYWILELFTTIIQHFFSDYFILNEGNCGNEFINLVCIVIADLMAGFLVLYTKCSMKPVNDTSKRKRSKKEIKLIHSNIMQRKKQNSFSLLLLISILHLISLSCYFLFYLFIKIKGIENIKILKNYQIDWLFGIDIIFRHIFSRLILKIKLSKYHKLSIIIIIIGLIFMSIFDFNFLLSGNIYYTLFIIARPLLFSLADVLDKILLTNDFFLPHFLMFNRGLIESVILLICTPILIYTSILEFNIINNNLLKRILMKCGFIIISFFKAFILLKIIYIFTAQYVSFLIVAELFGGIMNHLYEFFNSEKIENYSYEKKGIIFEIISLIIITFGALIYNEIIIINKFHLKENTKEELLLKEKKEEQEIVNITDLNEEENNNENKDISDITSDYPNEGDDN